jgi:RNA polymerase sigma factor (sigma-70 family)
MMKIDPMAVTASNDAELVNASLAGNRGAFREIVERYKHLVCSHAYSATGSLARSEEIAQETFVTAWQQLAALREPAKLRAWLCGIVHNLTRNAQRHAGRDPVHLAEAFDAANEAVAAEPSPPEQAVSREEEAILWRALEKIPEMYRVPLVLFYREQRSVESVARELELSTDAVKQRLSRGRAMLHEQVLGLVEGTLARSSPGRAFTVDVMAALPVMGTGVAVAAGLAGGQSAAGAKSGSWLGVLGTLCTAQVLWFVSSVAFVAGIGGYVGWQMGDPRRSEAESLWVARFWRWVALGLMVCVWPIWLIQDVGWIHPDYVAVLTVWLGLFYGVGGVPLAWWAISKFRRWRAREARQEGVWTRRHDATWRWAAAATVAAAGLLVVGLRNSHWHERILPTEVQRILAENPGADVRVNEQEKFGRRIEIVVREREQTVRYYGPLDELNYQLLRGSGRPFATRVQGRDYDVLGWPGRRLGMVAILLTGAGGALLLRTWRSRRRAVVAHGGESPAPGTV